MRPSVLDLFGLITYCKSNIIEKTALVSMPFFLYKCSDILTKKGVKWYNNKDNFMLGDRSEDI